MSLHRECGVRVCPGYLKRPLSISSLAHSYRISIDCGHQWRGVGGAALTCINHPHTIGVSESAGVHSRGVGAAHALTENQIPVHRCPALSIIYGSPFPYGWGLRPRPIDIYITRTARYKKRILISSLTLHLCRGKQTLMSP